MKRLDVHYCGWGEDWPLGRLADDGSNLLFEYAPEALAQGLELSPLSLKLRAPAYGYWHPFSARIKSMAFIRRSLQTAFSGSCLHHLP